MKNWLLYTFNIDPEEIVKKQDNYMIYYRENYYILQEYKNEKNNIDNLKKINAILKKFKNNYYIIITNRKNEIISNYNSQNFILLKVNGILNNDMNVTDFIKNTQIIPILNSATILPWNELWSKKVDYIEYQIANFGKNKKEVIDSFSFFSGLAENAICLLSQNKINYKLATIAIEHTRMVYPTYSEDYYNPVNLIVDFVVRDYAEYVKEKIFNGMDVDKDINTILSKIKNNKTDVILFYSRLLFPSTYFDRIEEILIDNKDEKTIDKYLDNLKLYIDSLKDIYYEISKFTEIIIPEWIKNQP